MAALEGLVGRHRQARSQALRMSELRYIQHSIWLFPLWQGPLRCNGVAPSGKYIKRCGQAQALSSQEFKLQHNKTLSAKGKQEAFLGSLKFGQALRSGKTLRL